jgi:dihydrofolate synthase/folylpolyglutamate synthase
MNLKQTLAKKPPFSSFIDTNRMPRAYEQCKNSFNLNPIIHIIGTNGKGSTGRFLALMLQQSGMKVGHYTSPHISEFRERFWIDGSLVSDDELENAHAKLQIILPKNRCQELSYFEYSTFLAAILFEDCDVVIMEAGLGGEWDATNVFPKCQSIITPIGLDHQDFLGNSIEEIASTKLRSITTTTIICANQDKRVVTVANSIAKEREILLVDAAQIPNENTLKEIDAYAKKYSYPKFLKDNIITSYSAARLLHVKPKISTLPPLDLRARYEWIEDNILLDCGHNPMAAKALVDTLGEEKYQFIYNAYEDKDFEEVLNILAPKIESLHVIPMGDANRVSAEMKIINYAKENGIKVDKFDFTLDGKKTYIVFGSFGVVAAFLKGMYAQ